MTITPETWRRFARYGLSIDDVQQAVAVAQGGATCRPSGIEGDRRFDIVVRLPGSRSAKTRKRLASLPSVPAAVAGGEQATYVPLQSTTPQSRWWPGSTDQARENGKASGGRHQANVRGRDLGSVSWRS